MGSCALFKHSEGRKREFTFLQYIEYLLVAFWCTLFGDVCLELYRVNAGTRRRFNQALGQTDVAAMVDSDFSNDVRPVIRIEAKLL
jgi:hypothetical protein